VTLQLANGKFVITSKGPSSGYPVSATLNGEKLPRPRFDHAQIAAGGSLEIELAAEPRAWE